MQAVCKLLRTEFPEVKAYVVFHCKDRESISNGDLIKDCAAFLDTQDQVIAMGTNCIKPEYKSDIIKIFRSQTSKPLLTYPNSGEEYAGMSKGWSGETSCVQNFVEMAAQWNREGCHVIGGCCRVDFSYIKALRQYADSLSKE